jgi:LPXTG-site transpeptidase (sortase) family protein
MDKKQAKKAFKIIAIIYIASFLIINWSDVSWVFNYNAVGTMVNDFFNPYPSIDASTMEAYFYPNHSQDNSQNNAVQPLKPAKTLYTDRQNILELPTLSLFLPIIFSQNADKEVIIKDLNKGVVYYPGSVYPGQPGQIVILGHSAPSNWPKSQAWQFTRLGELNIGDVVLIDLNNKQYKYIVKSKIIIEKGAGVPVSNNIANTNVLTLISCWPPGEDYQRIAVQTELVDN